jgi:glycosyltransferase involved in cell wall biosynthesis
MHTLLVIAGPLSGYSLALYRALSLAWPCTVKILRMPLPEQADFAHEQVSFAGIEQLDLGQVNAVEIARFVRQAGPSAVVVHGIRSVKATLVAAAVLPRTTPFLYVCDTNIHEVVSRRARLLARLGLYRTLFARVDVALTLGLTNDLAVRLLGAKRVEPIPVYPIDFALFDQARASAVERRDAGRKRLVIVARLVPEKNIAAAFDALTLDAALANGLAVTIVGDGPERGALETMARRSGLDCEFLGALPRSAVGAVIGPADALLLPSLSEPWGIVVCEALGLGVPVIASPAVGAAVSLAGLTRAVVLTRDPGPVAIAEALQVFLANATELGVAARNAADSVRQIYGLPSVTARLRELLCDLSERRRG